jgi:hypothetical protein
MSSLAGLLIAFPDQIDIETVSDAASVVQVRARRTTPLDHLRADPTSSKPAKSPQLAHDWSRKDRPNIV